MTQQSSHGMFLCPRLSQLQVCPARWSDKWILPGHGRWPATFFINQTCPGGKKESLGKLVTGEIWSGVLATLCLDISQRFLLFSPSNSFPEVFHFLNIFYNSRDFLLLLISQLIGDYSTLLIFWLSMSCKNTICFYNHSLTPLSRFRKARNTFCFMNHIYPII